MRKDQVECMFIVDRKEEKKENEEKCTTETFCILTSSMIKTKAFLEETGIWTQIQEKFPPRNSSINFRNFAHSLWGPKNMCNTTANYIRTNL